MCCDIHDGVNLADLTHFLAMAAAIFRAVGNTTRLQLIYQYTSHVHSSTQYSSTSTTVLPYHTIPGQVQVTVSVAVPALGLALVRVCTNTCMPSSGDLIGGTIWLKFEGKNTSPSVSDIQKGLANCSGLIANVRGGSHWVMITGFFSGTTFSQCTILVLTTIRDEATRSVQNKN